LTPAFNQISEKQELGVETDLRRCMVRGERGKCSRQVRGVQAKIQRGTNGNGMFKMYKRWTYLEFGMRTEMKSLVKGQCVKALT
jgi:hypothetical protein